MSAKLIDIVTNLDSYDPELTIYATKPWTCDSTAILALEPDEGGMPHEAELLAAEYFIEVFVAKEFLDGWSAPEGPTRSVRERCERLIRYAMDDA